MKWPTPQHRRVILLYAVSMALTHLPLGRVRKNSLPHPARQRETVRFILSSEEMGFLILSGSYWRAQLKGKRQPTVTELYERHPAHQVGSLAENYGLTGSVPLPQ